MNVTQPTVSQEAIARRAYELWEARGCPPGDGLDDWSAAVEELGAACGERNGGRQLGLRAWWTQLRRRIVGRAA